MFSSVLQVRDRQKMPHHIFFLLGLNFYFHLSISFVFAATSGTAVIVDIRHNLSYCLLFLPDANSDNR